MDQFIVYLLVRERQFILQNHNVVTEQLITYRRVARRIHTHQCAIGLHIMHTLLLVVLACNIFNQPIKFIRTSDDVGPVST